MRTIVLFVVLVAYSSFGFAQVNKFAVTINEDVFQGASFALAVFSDPEGNVVKKEIFEFGFFHETKTIEYRAIGDVTLHFTLSLGYLVPSKRGNTIYPCQITRLNIGPNTIIENEEFLRNFQYPRLDTFRIKVNDLKNVETRRMVSLSKNSDFRVSSLGKNAKFDFSHRSDADIFLLLKEEASSPIRAVYLPADQVKRNNVLEKEDLIMDLEEVIFPYELWAEDYFSIHLKNMVTGNSCGDRIMKGNEEELNEISIPLPTLDYIFGYEVLYKKSFERNKERARYEYLECNSFEVPAWEPLDTSDYRYKIYSQDEEGFEIATLDRDCQVEVFVNAEAFLLPFSGAYPAYNWKISGPNSGNFIFNYPKMEEMEKMYADVFVQNKGQIREVRIFKESPEQVKRGIADFYWKPFR